MLKQPDTVALLIGKGVNLDMPPTKVPPTNTMPDAHLLYRPAPFVIQAACTGCIPVLKNLVAAGCSLNAVGHIGLSKRY